MSGLLRYLFWVFFALALFFATCGFWVGRATAQDHGASHMRFHADYQSWRQPGSEASCCNARIEVNGIVSGDCYPTSYRLTPRGWQAMLAREDGGHWVDVPDAKIIREKNPDPSGTSGHLCWNHYTQTLLCAVPPTGAL